jgi:hypothetical protein
MHLELVYRPNIKIQRPGSEVLSVNSWIPSAADLERYPCSAHSGKVIIK